MILEQVSIQLDKAEIMERVDEMLAWEAVASEGSNINYTWDRFLRADPWISVGKHAHGRLTPRSVEAYDTARYAALPEATRRAHAVSENATHVEVVTKNLPFLLDRLGEGLSHCSITEHLDDELAFTVLNDPNVSKDSAAVQLRDGAKLKLHTVPRVTRAASRPMRGGIKSSST